MGGFRKPGGPPSPSMHRHTPERSTFEMFRKITLAVCLLAATSLPVAAQTQMKASLVGGGNIGGQEKKTLYTRLGGYDAIAAVTDDFVGRMVADKKLSRFFVGHSTDSLKK